MLGGAVQAGTWTARKLGRCGHLSGLLWAALEGRARGRGPRRGPPREARAPACRHAPGSLSLSPLSRPPRQAPTHNNSPSHVAQPVQEEDQGEGGGAFGLGGRGRHGCGKKRCGGGVSHLHNPPPTPFTLRKNSPPFFSSPPRPRCLSRPSASPHTHQAIKPPVTSPTPLAQTVLSLGGRRDRRRLIRPGLASPRSPEATWAEGGRRLRPGRGGRGRRRVARPGDGRQAEERWLSAGASAAAGSRGGCGEEPAAGRPA